MTFRVFALDIQCPQNFGDMHTDKQTDRQAGRHFLKIVKSRDKSIDVSKHAKSIENPVSKNFANPILSSYVYKESKKGKKIYIYRGVNNIVFKCCIYISSSLIG